MHLMLNLHFKNMKVKIIALLLFFAIIGNSCNDFLDVNETPNFPVNVPPEVVLPVVIAGAAFANNNEYNRFGSTIIAHTAGAGGGPQAYDAYMISAADFNNQFSAELYGGVIVDAGEVIRIADELGATDYSGVAKILQAYGFAMLTDLYGDIPYSQSPSTIINQPRYDSQMDIYQGNAELEIQSLFDLVREGIADLNAASTISPGADDFVYGGDNASWVRAGNTLLLKMANTISSVNPSLATSVINEVVAGGLFIDDNSEDFSVPFGASVGSQSPVHTYTNISLFQNNMILSDYFFNLLNGDLVDPTNPATDPRLSAFFTQGENGNGFTPFPNGGNAALLPDDPTDYSQFSSYVTGTSGEGPVRLLTNFQVNFILAEAALTLPGVSIAGAANAQSFYEAGIRASFDLAGVDPEPYFAANPGVLTLSVDPSIALEQIITQKYIAWLGNGLEAWNDWRRTGFPVIPESLSGAGANGQRVVRLVYPTQEINANPNSPDPTPQSDVRVWWDIN